MTVSIGVISSSIVPPAKKDLSSPVYSHWVARVFHYKNGGVFLKKMIMMSEKIIRKMIMLMVMEMMEVTFDWPSLSNKNNPQFEGFWWAGRRAVVPMMIRGIEIWNEKKKRVWEKPLANWHVRVQHSVPVAWCILAASSDSSSRRKVPVLKRVVDRTAALVSTVLGHEKTGQWKVEHVMRGAENPHFNVYQERRGEMRRPEAGMKRGGGGEEREEARTRGPGVSLASSSFSQLLH